MTEGMYQHTMSGLQRLLGPHHIHVLGTANNMANLYSKQHKWDEAQEMYVQVEADMSRTLGKDHYFIFGVINNHGLLCAERGEFAAARRMYEEAESGFERSLGSDHPHTKMVCHNIEQLNLSEDDLFRPN